MTEEARININRASAEELTGLPGIGQVLAGRLIAARPFEDEADLRRVSGIGEAVMARIRPQLVLNELEGETVQAEEPADAAPEEVPTAEEADSEMEVPEPVEVEAEVAPETAPQTSEGQDWITRGQAAWGMVAAAVVSILLSVSLTLAIMVAINNTLDVQRHQAVQDLRAEIRGVESTLGEVDSRLAGLSSRMEALEGLSGRVTTMEDEVGGMQTQIEEASTRVDEMSTSMESLSSTVDELDQRTDRLDQFLDGLRDLINGLDEGSQGGEG